MANTFLSRSATAGTSQQKFTFSFWFKRSKLGTSQWLVDGYASGSYDSAIYLSSANAFVVFDQASSTTVATDRLFRDTNAWYNAVVAVDTTQGSSSDRVKIYINGVQETAFSTANYPAQNANFELTGNGATIFIGKRNAGDYFDGIMSYVACIDGTAEAPTLFGSTDATTGEWKIKTSVTPSVAWGNNGFFLFKNNAAVADQSGEGHNFTLGGGTLTATKDCPDNVFSVFNSLEYYGSDGATLSNGNTTYASPSAGHRYLRSTLAASTGKYYAEFKLAVSAGSGTNTVGITDHEMNDGTDELSQDNYSYAYVDDGSVRANGSNVDTGEATYGANDIIMVAMDLTNSKLYFGKNGTWINSGDPTSGSTGTGAYSIQPAASTLTGCYHFGAGDWVNPGTNTWSANFGNGIFGTTAVASAGTNASNNGIFEYNVPAGYTALSTKGLNL